MSDAVASLRVSRGPWATALRRLSRDKAAMACLAVFILIVVVSLLAPAYAAWANTDPFRSTLDATIDIDGQQVAVMEQSTEGLGLGYTPIGPTWELGNYFLGADNQGRDVMARLLYGGRNSLLIAGASTVITILVATIVGLAAGFFLMIFFWSRQPVIRLAAYFCTGALLLTQAIIFVIWLATLLSGHSTI